MSLQGSVDSELSTLRGLACFVLFLDDHAWDVCLIDASGGILLSSK